METKIMCSTCNGSLPWTRGLIWKLEDLYENEYILGYGVLSNQGIFTALYVCV
jgi:hypothetical protein